MDSASSIRELQGRVDGYFDLVSSIFEDQSHPVILIEDCAMRWMGLGVDPRENLDLLIRDSQFDSILASLLATGHFERVEQDLGYRCNDEYVKQVPRLHDLRCDPGPNACVNLWTESVYKLKVEDIEAVPVPDTRAWNSVLMEERFATVPETQARLFQAQSQIGVKVLPWIRSSTRGASFFIPSIPKLVDALLDQERCFDDHSQKLHQMKSDDRSAYRVSYNVTNFIRYLYLERQSQRETILSLLAERNRSKMETRINKFKRKPPSAVPESLLPRDTFATQPVLV